jgi:enamine deaminase RidA (YjgF/YER057c/UK114 family)
MRKLTRVLIVVALASAAACANTPTTKTGLPWWPQGPGNPDGSQRAAGSNETAGSNEQVAQSTQPQPQASAPAPAPDTAAPASRYGDLLFLSGQTAAEAGSIGQQADAVLQKVGAILETQRLTMANVVHVTIHLTNLADLGAVDAAYARHFRGALPARTVVGVAQLPGGARVQVSAIAGR